jgi:hypothetical protein
MTERLKPGLNAVVIAKFNSIGYKEITLYNSEVKWGEQNVKKFKWKIFQKSVLRIRDPVPF